MTATSKLHQGLAAIQEAEERLKEARKVLRTVYADGGELPTVIGPIRFEEAYRGLARHLGGGHDYYDQWTQPSQASHRGYARAVLEGAGFQVQERQP